MRRNVPGDPVAALARNPQIAGLTHRHAARSATRLRRSLAGTDPRAVQPADAGLALGQLDALRTAAPGRRSTPGGGDTVVAFMAPGSGKTTAQAIPFVLSAPGAVIATSNKSDLWAATAALRAADGGRVWLFDPQHITYQPQTWWWDLLAGLHTVEDAHRLAGHFVLTVADENRRDLWGPAAQDLLAALFLAAASSDHTLHDVAEWLNEPAVPTPIELLADRRVHRHGRLPARRTKRRRRNPRRHLPDRPHRRPCHDRPRDHGLGHPASARPPAGAGP